MQGEWGNTSVTLNSVTLGGLGGHFCLGLGRAEARATVVREARARVVREAREQAAFIMGLRGTTCTSHALPLLMTTQMFPGFCND